MQIEVHYRAPIRRRWAADQYQWFVLEHLAREEGQTKEGDGGDAVDNNPLDDNKKTAYRAIVARANEVSPDRPDIAYAGKELARGMSAPTVGDWCRSKRLAR